MRAEPSSITARPRASPAFRPGPPSRTRSESGFGDVVGTAGDVNGDGYADVIVGAFSTTTADRRGPGLRLPRLAAGLAVAPSWIGESDQDYAWFGESVATAGDVNADGYADVIVSATLYDNGQFNEGRAFVYHGSAAGLGNVPAGAAKAITRMAGTEARYRRQGMSTATDTRTSSVGAPHHDDGQFDEGWAFVYHGAATGLAVAPSWIGRERAGRSLLRPFGRHGGGRERRRVFGRHRRGAVPRRRGGR